ncbi:MAG: NAD(+)/NADH kinase [Eubacterium sp.]|nr:NAD(+)/NADH kinase [Eubacterium sp.]
MIITNKQKDMESIVTNQIRFYLEERGAVCHCFKDYSKEKTESIEIPQGTECILVIGGDGTILNAATKVIGANIPLLGINLGTLGFLAEVTVNDINETLEHLLEDDYQIEHRHMIDCEVYRQGRKIAVYTALNDIVISKSSYSNVVGLNVKINDTDIESYYADGVIICTPTGSTAYNLSAGGPILNPTCKNFVLTPICPHSLTTRSVVMAKEDIITIRIMSPSAGRDCRQSMVIYDGRKGVELYPEDELRIFKSVALTPFIKTRKMSFAKILKEKMR